MINCGVRNAECGMKFQNPTSPNDFIGDPVLMYILNLNFESEADR